MFFLLHRACITERTVHPAARNGPLCADILPAVEKFIFHSPQIERQYTLKVAVNRHAAAKTPLIVVNARCRQCNDIQIHIRRVWFNAVEESPTEPDRLISLIPPPPSSSIYRSPLLLGTGSSLSVIDDGVYSTGIGTAVEITSARDEPLAIAGVIPCV